MSNSKSKTETLRLRTRRAALAKLAHRPIINTTIEQRIKRGEQHL